jgi:hypothetical protein
MFDVTSHYIVRAKSVPLKQYESLRSELGKVMQHSDWVVHQRSFVAGARSLNEAEFRENLEYFNVPSTSIDSIRTKIAMTILGRSQPAQLGTLYLLSSTLSRRGTLTNLGRGR